VKLKILFFIMEISQNWNSKSVWGVVIRAIITVLSAISGASFGTTIA
jgi:hypothetical protein